MDVVLGQGPYSPGLAVNSVVLLVLGWLHHEVAFFCGLFRRHRHLFFAVHLVNMPLVTQCIAVGARAVER